MASETFRGLQKLHTMIVSDVTCQITWSNKLIRRSVSSFCLIKILLDFGINPFRISFAGNPSRSFRKVFELLQMWFLLLQASSRIRHFLTNHTVSNHRKFELDLEGHLTVIEGHFEVLQMTWRVFMVFESLEFSSLRGISCLIALRYTINDTIG